MRTITPGAARDQPGRGRADSETDYTYRRGEEQGRLGRVAARRRRRVAASPRRVRRPALRGDRRRRQLDRRATRRARATAPDRRGEYQYRLNGGGWAALPGDASSAASATARTTTSQVRAVATVDGTTYAGAASSAASRQCRTAPSTPRPAAQQNAGHAGASSAGMPRARPTGAPSRRCRSVSTAAAGRTSASAAPRNVGDGYEQTHSITVRAQDTDRASGPESVRRRRDSRVRAAAAGLGHLEGQSRTGSRTARRRRARTSMLTARKASAPAALSISCSQQRRHVRRRLERTVRPHGRRQRQRRAQLHLLPRQPPRRDRGLGAWSNGRRYEHRVWQ